MAAHRIFCSKGTLNEIIRLRKDRPYSSVYSTIDKLGDLYLVDIDKSELLKWASSNAIVNYLVNRRENRDIYCNQSISQFLKKPKADDIFLLLPPDSRLYSQYSDKMGVLLASSLTKMQIIDDLVYTHFRPYNLLTNDQKENLHKHGEEYENISSWKDVLSTIRIDPINSAVIIDNYLLSKNFERRKPSLYSLLEALVPKGLAIPFHLTIFVYTQDDIKKEKMEKVVSEIHQLNLGSSIKVSIVAHTRNDITHDRQILTNYHLITSGRGFGVIDFNGVKENAQGQVVSTFHNIGYLPSMNSIKHLHSHVLDWLKEIYIDRKGMDALYAFEVGDDFNNRLLSDNPKLG